MFVNKQLQLLFGFAGTVLIYKLAYNGLCKEMYFLKK